MRKILRSALRHLRFAYMNLLMRLGATGKQQCGRCGVWSSASWWCPDALWFEINGCYAGTYCVECFDALTQERGFILNWVPMIYPDDARWSAMKERFAADPEYAIAGTLPGHSDKINAREAACKTSP